MNLIFLDGKIIKNVEFKFIIKSKNKSIAILKLKLNNNSMVTVKAYNELADYCYKELKKEDKILLEGYLNSKLEVILKCVKKL